MKCFWTSQNPSLWISLESTSWNLLLQSDHLNLFYRMTSFTEFYSFLLVPVTLIKFGGQNGIRNMQLEAVLLPSVAVVCI